MMLDFGLDHEADGGEIVVRVGQSINLTARVALIEQDTQLDFLGLCRWISMRESGYIWRIYLDGSNRRMISSRPCRRVGHGQVYGSSRCLRTSFSDILHSVFVIHRATASSPRIQLCAGHPKHWLLEIVHILRIINFLLIALIDLLETRRHRCRFRLLQLHVWHTVIDNSTFCFLSSYRAHTFIFI